MSWSVSLDFWDHCLSLKKMSMFLFVLCASRTDEMCLGERVYFLFISLVSISACLHDMPADILYYFVVSSNEMHKTNL